MSEFYDMIDREELDAAIQSTSEFISGTPTDTGRWASFSAQDLQETVIRHQLDLIDSNAPLAQLSSAVPSSTLAPMSASSTASSGARDQLKGIAQKANAGQALTGLEMRSLESVMLLSGYAASQDGNLSNDADFSRFFEDFVVQDRPLLSLTGHNAELHAQAQAEAQARAEAQAAMEIENADISAQLSSGLVYAGYLDPAQADDAIARAAGMQQFMIDNRRELTPNELIAQEQRAYTDFDSWQPTAAALDIFNEMSAHTMLSRDFQEDLESADPGRIEMAQNFMRLQGHDIEANGTITPQTRDVGQDMISEQQSLPTHILQSEYGFQYAAMINMAERGQLLLPENGDEFRAALEAGGLNAEDIDRHARMLETLPAAEIKTPNDMFSQEQYMASVMIRDNPGVYENYLAQQNELRADATLDVAVIAPVIDTEVTNNPLNLAVNGVGDEALTYGANLANAAIGQTVDGIAVFEGDAAGYAFIDHLRQHAEAAGTGSEISLHDALRVHHYATETVADASFAPIRAASMGGGSDIPEMSYANRIHLEVKGDLENFDLNNPQDIQQLLTGIAAHVNRDDLSMDGQPNILVAYQNDPRFADDHNSIIRVAENGGTNPLMLDDGIRVAETQIDGMEAQRMIDATWEVLEGHNNDMGDDGTRLAEAQIGGMDAQRMIDATWEALEGQNNIGDGGTRLAEAQMDEIGGPVSLENWNEFLADPLVAQGNPMDDIGEDITVGDLEAFIGHEIDQEVAAFYGEDYAAPTDNAAPVQAGGLPEMSVISAGFTGDNLRQIFGQSAAADNENFPTAPAQSQADPSIFNPEDNNLRQSTAPISPTMGGGGW